MFSVGSIGELIEKLNHSDSTNQGKIIKQMNIPISEFEAYACWDKSSYTRNCIYRSDDYELILLCWKKGCETPIHDHGGQNCWVYQVEGNLTETRYERNDRGNLNEIGRIELNPGKLTFMNNDMGYHKLSNNSDGRAMTLHIYVSPIISCNVFNDKEDAFDFMELEYDTMNGSALSNV